MSDEITRNASPSFGDDVVEMTGRPRIDDRTADALFSGRSPLGQEDHADVAVFAERLRTAAMQAPAPAPNAALAAVLADGLSTDGGDLPVAVGHDTPASASGSPTPNRRRTKRMLELLVTKLAGVSLLVKASVAAAALTAGATGVGITGSLPAAAQDAFDRAFSPAADDTDSDLVPVEVPDTGVQVVSEQTDVDSAEAVVPERPDQGSRPEVPGADGRATASENAGENGAHGRAVAEEAARDGREFGQRRAEEARQRQDAQPGQDASARGRERADEASDGRSQRGEDAADAGADNAASAPGSPVGSVAAPGGDREPETTPIVRD